MKKIFLSIFLVFSLISCSDNSTNSVKQWITISSNNSNDSSLINKKWNNSNLNNNWLSITNSWNWKWQQNTTTWAS